MLPDKETMCHLTAFEKRCFDMVTQHNCRKWIFITGMDPQSGEVLNYHDCADHFDHKLKIENTRALNEIAASLQNERNEIIKRLDVGNVLSAGSRQLLGAVVRGAFDEQRALTVVVETAAMIENKPDGS